MKTQLARKSFGLTSNVCAGASSAINDVTSRFPKETGADIVPLRNRMRLTNSSKGFQAVDDILDRIEARALKAAKA
jgi:hypothetical protein